MKIQKSEEDKSKQETKRKSRTEVIAIGSSIIFGVISSIFIYLSYRDNKELNKKDIEIQNLSEKITQRDRIIDSLNQISSDTLSKK